MTGTVVKNTGSDYLVATDGSGERVPCKIKGKFRIQGIRTTNPVAVGDRVDFNVGDDGIGLIYNIEDRRNYIIRRASNLSKAASIIAANVDCAMLVATLVHPPTSFTFIDRFLASAQAYGVPAMLVINKADLLEADPDDTEFLDAVLYLYRSIGYPAMAVSALTGAGLDELRRALAGKTTLLSGNSGVGKSSLINALIPGADLRTGAISEANDSGMHTTTFSEMLELPGGGRIIDTPGVRGFGTVEFEREEVGHYFPEIFAESAHCRFGNCTHTHEPGCAVLAAVADSRIAQSRYSSYLSILEECSSGDKYRKPQ